MRRPSSLRVLTALLFSLAIVFTSGGDALANAGVTQVSGLLSPDDPNDPQCSALGPGMVVSGTLEGCWYITSITKQKDPNPGGGFYAAGTETFEGCLGDACGHLFTTFTFTAKFAADGSEVHGRCHHPIIGGDGDFTGATGVISMHDLPNGCATYKGNLRF
jgi:hypothetical protein